MKQIKELMAKLKKADKKEQKKKLLGFSDKQKQKLENEIKQLKKKNKELQKDKEKFHAIAERTSDIITVSTLELNPKQVYVSPSIKRGLGYEPEELIGKPFFEFIHPDDKKMIFPILKKYMQKFAKKILIIGDSSLTETIDFRLKNKAGRWRNMQSTINFFGKNLLSITRDITESKKAEEKLKASEEKFHQLFDKMNSGVAVYEVIDKGKDFIFKDFNKAAERIDNQKKEELIGKSIFEMRPGIEEYGLIDTFKKVLKTGESAHHPISIYKDERVVKWYENFIYKLSTGEIVAMFQDVTERKQADDRIKGKSIELEKQFEKSEEQRIATLTVLSDLNETTRNLKIEISERELAEEALEENEEKLRLMIDNSPIGFSATDLKGNFIDVNPAVCNMVGYTSEEILHKHFDQFSHPDDRKQNNELYKKLLENKIPHFDLEKRYIHKNGRIVNVLIRSQIVRDEKRKPLFEMAITEDITIRKKAEEEIRKLSTAVTQSPSVIAITDIKGNLEYVNPKFTELTGYTLEEAKGMNPRILKSGEQPDEIYKDLWETLSSGKEWRGEFHNKKKNGELFWEAASLSPIFDDQGKIINFIKVAEDVTEQKKAEDQIKQNLQEKTLLLQEIYHRTKNNMQVVSSMLKLQTRNIENRVQADSKDIEFIYESFNAVINKITAMSLVHQKLYEAEDLSHINLKEYIGDLVRSLMISFRIRSESISLKLDMEDVFLLIDSAIPLGLVLSELISNVFKHGYKDDKKVEINVRLFKEDDETINIHISDNGVGISSDIELENVSTMGLQTVFSLVEFQLKGKITYKTENGLKWKISFKDNLHEERV